MDRDTFLLLVCQNTYLLAWQKAEDKLPRLNKMNDAWPIGGRQPILLVTVSHVKTT